MGRYTGKKCRLISLFGLTATYFIVEIVVGHLTNSMALVADSFHMLSDIAALVIAFVSVRMAPKSWDKNTYGWARAEVLGALVNAVFLIALCFSIVMESLKRFYEPEEVDDPVLILIVGSLGLVVNLLGLFLFHDHGSHGHSHGGGNAVNMGTLPYLSSPDNKDREEGDKTEPNGTITHIAQNATTTGEKGVKNLNQNGTEVDHHQQQTSSKSLHFHSHSSSDGGNLNMRGVFLHVMADALGSVVVIVSALVMWQTEWEYKCYVDPALSLIMVMLLMCSVWPLLIESALILLQTVPTHINADLLKAKLLESSNGILAVHEFHIWRLAGDRIIASAHIGCLNMSEYTKIAEHVKEFFHNEGIHSTTIQPEFVEINDADEQCDQGDMEKRKRTVSGGDCVLVCPKTPEEEAPNCQKSKCCVLPSDEAKYERDV